MQDNEMTTRKRRRVTVLRVIMALLLVAGCAFAIFRLSLRSKLNARIEAIRAAGYPVTCAELDEWYAIPEDAENAAYTITDAFSYYVEPHYTQFVPIVGPVELPARTEPLAEETKAFTALFIIDNKEALGLLHAGAAIENCRYPVDLSAGHEALLPDLSSLKKGARLLSVEAISHADSEPNLAVRSIKASFGLARSLEEEPVLVSQLVRVACQGLTISTIEWLVNRTDFTDGQLDDLSEAVVEAQAPSAFSRAFVGERCMNLAMLKMSPIEVARFISMDVDTPSSALDANLTALPFALHRFAGLTDRSTIIYLDLMAEYIEATKLPLNSRREAIEAIEDRCRATWRKDFVLRRLMSGLLRIDEIGLRRVAGLLTAQTALAIQRYRLATGRRPDSLSDLVPAYLDAVPADPFDGNELRYKKLERGFIVYSIGQDLSDDGGKEKEPRKAGGQKAPNWDITFIVER